MKEFKMHYPGCVHQDRRPGGIDLKTGTNLNVTTNKKHVTCKLCLKRINKTPSFPGNAQNIGDDKEYIGNLEKFNKRKPVKSSNGANAKKLFALAEEKKA